MTKLRNGKRLISLLLATLCLSLLGGCGSGNQGKKAEAPKPAEPPVKISWVPQGDQPVDENSPLILELEKRLNADFDLIYIDRNKFNELISVRIAAGEIPDVMRLESDMFAKFAQSGVLAELPEATIKQYMPKGYELVKTNSGNSNIWKHEMVNGKIYGLPLLNQNGNYANVPVWRDDWLANVGINKIPATLEEAEKAFYKFVNEDPDKNGKKDTYAISNGAFGVIGGAFGVPVATSFNTSNTKLLWTERDGKIVASFVLPEFQEMLVLLNKWYKDGIIDPEFITGENKGQAWSSSVALWNGKIGFTALGWYYHMNPAIYEGAKPSANYENFKKLQGEKATYMEGGPLIGPKGKAGVPCGAAFSGQTFAIGVNAAKDPKKIPKILEINEKMVTDQDVLDLVINGLESQQFKKETIEKSKFNPLVRDLVKTDKVEVRTRIVEAAEAAKAGTSTNGIGYFAVNDFASTIATNPIAYLYPEKVCEKRLGGKIINNPVWGALPSYPQYKAAIDKKIEEGLIKFIMGDRKMSEYGSFIEEVKKMGLDQLTTEANDWYNTFVK